MSNQVSTTFPDSTYTSANKPSVETLKTDIAAIETAHNASDTASVKTTDTNVSANDWVLDEDAMGSDSNQKLSTQQSIKAYVDAAISGLFPVGSVYVNYAVATNPATLLGFGTWVAVTEEVLVGKAGSGTFASIGSVGAETDSAAHTHTGPSHTHTGPSHTHTVATEATGDITTYGSIPDSGFDTSGPRGLSPHNHGGATGSQGTGNTGGSGTGNTGAMSANATLSTIQPTRVVYMWRRQS